MELEENDNSDQEDFLYRISCYNWLGLFLGILTFKQENRYRKKCLKTILMISYPIHSLVLFLLTQCLTWIMRKTRKIRECMKKGGKKNNKATRSKKVSPAEKRSFGHFDSVQPVTGGKVISRKFEKPQEVKLTFSGEKPAERLVELECSARCRLTMYQNCAGKAGPGLACPTPDCWGVTRGSLDQSAKVYGKPEPLNTEPCVTKARIDQSGKVYGKPEPLNTVPCVTKERMAKTKKNSNRVQVTTGERTKPVNHLPKIMKDTRHLTVPFVELRKVTVPENSVSLKKTRCKKAKRKQTKENMNVPLELNFKSMIQQRKLDAVNRIFSRIEVTNIVSHISNISKKDAKFYINKLSSSKFVTRDQVSFLVDSVRKELLMAEDNLEYRREEVKTETEEREEDVCPVCLEALGEEAESLKCGHQYHQTCIASWLHQQATCPTCRTVTDLVKELGKPKNGPGLVL